MHTNHIDELLEAYLDDQLSAEQRQKVDLHLKICPNCTHRLLEAKRLDRELASLMQTALGQPALPPALRHKVKEAVYDKRSERPFYLFWLVSARVLNAAGAIAVVLVLGFGLFMLIRTQLPGGDQLSTAAPLSPDRADPKVTFALPTPSPLPVAQSKTVPPAFQSSLEDTLPAAAPPVVQPVTSTQIVEQTVVEVAPPFVPREEVKINPVPLQEEAEVEAEALPEIPGGAIAFALFDATPGLEVYEVHLINPDGSEHRRFPLAGVSEPVLHPKQNDYPLAVRGWGGPGISRQIVSSDWEGNSPQTVSHFWEDAQPDWSPIENRLIFASQRESDRRWRLYTAWGDGSLEVNLRREGKAPTLAPDGQRFAFEGCDETGSRCGLWLSNLGESEREAQPFLVDPEAKSPDWSPVSEEIVYMSRTKDNWDIYLIDSTGHNKRRLTDDPANDGLPTWSPDGQWLAFASDRSGRWGIWLLHLASDQLYPVISFEENLLLTPPTRYPLYHEHGERQWWDEQLSWGP